MDPLLKVFADPERHINEDSWRKIVQDGGEVLSRVGGGLRKAESCAMEHVIDALPKVKVSLEGSGKQTTQTTHVPECFPLDLGPNMRAEYDLSSLSGACGRLQDQENFLSTLVSHMPSIKGLVDGPQRSGAPSLGSFPEAQKIKNRHDHVYAVVESIMKVVVEDLRKAQSGLGQVMENYQSVEDENRLAAERIEQVLISRTSALPSPPSKGLL